MDNNTIEDKLNFLKEKTKFFDKLANDEKFLFEEVNNLKNKSNFKEILNMYRGDSSAGNCLRYMILKYIEKGITINPKIIDKLKEIYIQANNLENAQILKKEFNFSDNMISNVINNHYNKNGQLKNDPYRTIWNNSFSICYTFFYQNDVKNYLGDLGKYFLEKLNLTEYSFEPVNFHGTRNKGQNILGVYLYPEKLGDYKNAVQFAFEIHNGEYLVKKHKGKDVKNVEIKEFKKEWVNTIDDAYQYFEKMKSTVVNENNLLINNFRINKSKINYWWLSANEKNSFRFYDLPVGEQDYYTIMDNGNPRQKPKNFKEIKKGDKFVGYDGSPKACISSVGEVIDKDEEKVYIKNIKIFKNPVSLSVIQEQTNYLFSDCFGTNGTLNRGSLFKLTKEEFDYILNMGDKKVSDKIYKNLILYGPPGTGKTYNTVVEAMSIINNEKYENVSDEEYSKFKKDFDDLLGKRIEFVTFHQSYSYEEFVEGIKPYIPKSVWKYNDKEIEENEKFLPDVKYIGKDGVFKKICDKAKPDFEIVYEKFKEIHPQGTNLDKLLNFDYEKKENSIYYDYGNDNTEREIPLSILKNFYDKNLVFNNAKEIQDAMNNVGYTPNLNSYNLMFYNELLRIKDELNQPCVLIIDEINRGNISKIFGELITLIEEDKRGKLKVRLPYSQDEFTVPENLYIIGTMNTSDRSIASVDIALRRRFTFKEMMPKPDLVADFGCKFDDIYKILNKKITILADRDHQIGHSYFIKDKHEGENINDLQDIWFDSVLPLLNEYFYGDWEKLQEILGKAEKEEGKKEDDKYTSFIKKLTPCINDDNCYDKETDCFDFVKENEIDFEKALDNAFKKSLEKVFPDKYKTNNTTQGSVKENTEE